MRRREGRDVPAVPNRARQLHLAGPSQRRSFRQQQAGDPRLALGLRLHLRRGQEKRIVCGLIIGAGGKAGRGRIAFGEGAALRGGEVGEF